MSSTIALVMVLARARNAGPEPDTWAAWRWLGTADERVLWAILAGAAVLAAWGAVHGWRREP